MPLGDTGAGPDGGPNTGYGGQDSFGSGAGNDGYGGGGGALAGAPSLGYGNNLERNQTIGKWAGSILGGVLGGPLVGLAGRYLGEQVGPGIINGISGAFSGGHTGGGGWSPESGSDSRGGGQYSTPYYNYFAGPNNNGSGDGLYRDWTQAQGQGQPPTPPAYQNTAPLTVAMPQFAAPPQFGQPPQQPPQQGGGLGLPMAPIGYQNDSPSVGAGMSPMAGGTPPPGLLALLSRLQAGGQQPPPQLPAGLMGGNQWA